MANKYNKGVSGSVQEKRGMLYLVVSFKSPITQKHKVKWVAWACFGLSQVGCQQQSPDGYRGYW